jgi:hypothetical protein
MKHIAIIIGAGVIAALYQWRQLVHYRETEVSLRKELHLLKPRSAAPSSSDPKNGRNLPVPAPPTSGPTDVPSILQSLQDMMDRRNDQGDPDDAEKQAILTWLMEAEVGVLSALPGELAQSRLPERWKRELTSAVLHSLSQHDPRAAAGAALEHSNHRTLTTILQQWHTAAPQAAAAWITAALADGRIAANTFTDGPYTGPEGMERLHSMAQSAEVAGHPGEASQKFHNLTVAKTASVMEESLRLLNPDGRTALLRSLAADPQVPSPAFAAFGQALGNKISFADSRALLEQAALSPAQFSAAASGYISRSIGKDTPAALTWFLSNTSSDDRAKGYSNILTQWIHADYNAAATWLRDLPAGADKDSGIGFFAPMIVGKEPESAADWAASIQAPDARQIALSKVFAAWPDKTSAAAYYRTMGWAVP